MKRIFRSIFDFLRPAAKEVAGVAIDTVLETLTAEAEIVAGTVEELSPDLPGDEKFNVVRGVIVKRHPSIQSFLINLAIELAVGIVKGYLDKRE